MILNPFSTPLNGGNGPEFAKSGYILSNSSTELYLERTPIIVNAFGFITGGTVFPTTSGSVYCKPNEYTYHVSIITNIGSAGKSVIMLNITFYSNGRLKLSSTNYGVYYTIYYAP